MQQVQAEEVLELLSTEEMSSEREKSLPIPGPGFMSGIISQFDDETGVIHVIVPRVSLLEPMIARSIIPITENDVGQEVLVAMETDGAFSAYIVGRFWKKSQTCTTQPSSVTATVDGERVVIDGKKEIVLKCGKASITLTRAGKVLIRGTYLLSRSSGVNRVKGGSVQIN